VLKTYQYPKFPFVRPAELDSPQTRHVPVIVVGAGPVGLSAAIDLAQRNIPVVVLDEDDTVSIGSRGVCYAKRALEILDRYGVGERVVQKGVSWNVGRTFFRDEEVFRFNLVPEPDHHRPGMVNLQQYYLEEYLIDRARELPNIDLRWKSTVIGVTPGEDAVTVRVETPAGAYALSCDWLIAADGARSPIRRMLGLDIEGKIFMDRFLIADVVMKADFPPERWFWFDPPFHPGQSVLLHRQADDVWRIDFQLGWDADPEEEKKPERVIPRIRAMLVTTANRARMGERLHLPVPPHEALQPWARALRRRFGAPGLALRGAWRQFRHPGRRQPRMEARTGDAGQGARGPARYL